VDDPKFTECWTEDLQPVVEFYNLNDLDERKLDLKPNTWILPHRWNQGSYDAVRLVDNGIWFIQVTCAKSKQPLKQRFLFDFIRKMADLGLVLPNIQIRFVLSNRNRDFDAPRNPVFGDPDAKVSSSRWLMNRLVA
jgi:hypothetical protein